MDYDDNLNIQNDDDIENALLQNLKTRFNRGEIYTFTGKLLISINPLKTIDLYSGEKMAAYRLKPRGSMPPHIYSIGTEAIMALHESKKSQCVIVTGESGAGKTVITHHLTQFMCKTNPKREDIMKHAANSLKLLDIFGNAETPENPNSSRFVKFLQIKFNSNNEASSIYISYQLLEISRLCGSTAFGSNFHIFYLLTGAPTNLKDSLGLSDGKFKVLAPRNVSHCSQYNFDDLDFSLDQIGLPKDVKQFIYETLAAILHLCNLEFDDDSFQHAQIFNVACLNDAARLLRLDSIELSDALTKQKFKTQVETSCISIPLNRCNAMTARDTMVKSIYKHLFQFLVSEMNKTHSETVTSKYIAILDIAGFECQVMGQNSFEQLCINYINETVQQFWMRKQIKDELDWYAVDGIHIPDVNFLDNRTILNLFEEKTDGIWSLLEDESKKRTPSNETFFENLKTKCSKNPAFTLPKIGTATNNSFIIKHFTKNVCYSAENFVQKNTQIMSTTILNIINKCLNQFVDKDILNQPNNSKSVTNGLKNDLSNLMSKLNEHDSHFIKCIKPNNKGIIDLFDYDFIKSQLKSNSIVPYINLMKKGYPTRIPYANFFPNFDSFLPKDVVENQRRLANLLLLSIGYETKDFKLGQTQVFFRPGKSTMFYQLNMLDTDVIRDLASKIESTIKSEQQHTVSQEEKLQIEQTVQLLDHSNISNLSHNKRKDTEITQDDLQPKKQKCADNIQTQVICNDNSFVEITQKVSEDEEKSFKKGHWPYHDTKRSASRCKLPTCKYLTHVFCDKCEKNLCFTRERNCFVAYHKKN